MIEDYKYKKFLNEIPLPTTDEEIKQLLKKLNEPEELFNEKNYERRDRLLNCIFSLIKNYKGNLPDEIKEILNLKKKKQKKKKLEEEFYTEASKDLINFRKELIIFSLLKSKRRLQKQKENNKINLSYKINNNELEKKLEEKMNRLQIFNSNNNFSNFISLSSSSEDICMKKEFEKYNPVFIKKPKQILNDSINSIEDLITNIEILESHDLNDSIDLSRRSSRRGSLKRKSRRKRKDK